MGQYWLDLDRSDAEILGEWSESFALQEKILLDDGGTRAIRFYLGEQWGGRAGASCWTVVPPSADTQLFAKVRHGSNTAQWSQGVAGRISGTNMVDSYTDGYYAHAQEAPMVHSMMVTEGARTTLDTQESAEVDDGTTYYYMLYDLVGNEQRIRVAKEVAVLAGLTPFVTTDSSHAEGQVGVYGRMRSADRYIYIAAFGIGTDGDPAPTGPVGGISAEPFLLRHNPRTNKVIPVLSSPTVTDTGAACVRPRVSKGF